MRQVVLDTETTGLSTSQGHRIIEIGCIELMNRRLTGRHFHRFLNPERAIDEGAEAVHGISLADLETQPKFAEVVEEFLEFIRGAELVIHNAEFDVGFLEYELGLIKHAQPNISDHAGVLDTLSLARSLHPGQRNSLDALCKRYELDASNRELHGALIDAELLARVYLAMTGGQTALTLDHSIEAENGDKVPDTLRKRRTDLHLVVRKANDDELAKHEKMLDFVEKSGGCLWRE
jgi:DNA polymerase-3 subunit epsilon